MVTQSRLGIRRSLAHYIRDHTRQGEELVDLVLDVMRGHVRGKEDAKLMANTGLRLEAIAWLADRGWGKPPQHLEIDVGENTAQAALREYTLEQLELLHQGLAATSALEDGASQ